MPRPSVAATALAAAPAPPPAAPPARRPGAPSSAPTGSGTDAGHPGGNNDGNNTGNGERRRRRRGGRNGTPAWPFVYYSWTGTIHMWPDGSTAPIGQRPRAPHLGASTPQHQAMLSGASMFGTTAPYGPAPQLLPTPHLAAPMAPAPLQLPQLGVFTP